MKTTFTLPAGQYIITDPCYVIFGERYDSLTDVDKDIYEFEFDGKKGVIFATHSDGQYDAIGSGTFDDFGVGVDTARIGVIPLELATIKNDCFIHENIFTYPLGFANGVSLGGIVQFDEPFECTRDGVISFGNEEASIAIEF